MNIGSRQVKGILVRKEEAKRDLYGGLECQQTWSRESFANPPL